MLDWNAVIWGFVGGGAATTLLTRLIQNRHERGLQLRAAKVDAILDYIQGHLEARAALSDLEQAVTGDAETFTAAQGRVHQRIRDCRVTAARMFLMLPPEAEVRPLIDEIIKGLYEAERALADERSPGGRASGGTSESPASRGDDSAAARARLAELHKARRSRESRLLVKLHHALWPSARRAVGARFRSRDLGQDEILSPDVPGTFDLYSGGSAVATFRGSPVGLENGTSGGSGGEGPDPTED
jgi:hypothetical protein